MQHLFAIQSVHDPDAFVMIHEEPGMHIVGSLVTSLANYAIMNASAPRELIGVRTDRLKLLMSVDAEDLDILTPLDAIRESKPTTSLWYRIKEERRDPKQTPPSTPDSKRKLSYDTDEDETPLKRRRTNGGERIWIAAHKKNGSAGTKVQCKGDSNGIDEKGLNNITNNTNNNADNNDKSRPRVLPVIHLKPQASSPKQPRSPVRTEKSEEEEQSSSTDRFSEQTLKKFSEMLHETDNPWITPNYLFLLHGFPVDKLSRQDIYDKIEDFLKESKIATNPTFDVVQHSEDKDILLLSLRNKTISKRLIDKTFKIDKYSINFVQVPTDKLPELTR